MEKITRLDFLKKSMLGVFSIFIASKLGAVTIADRSGKDADDSILRSATLPGDHSKMWLNTGSGNNMYGIQGKAIPAGALCYWDDYENGWKPTTATWG